MGLRHKIRLFTVISLFIVAGVPHVQAAGKDKRGNDEAHIREVAGTVALNLGRYDEAAREFEAAYGLNQDPGLLFLLGQAYRLGAKLEKAMAAYNSFLRSATPTYKNREQFERAAADIELISTILLKRPATAPARGPAETAPSSPPVAIEPPAAAEPTSEAPAPVAAKPAPTNLTAATVAVATTPERDMVLVATPAPQPPPDQGSRVYKKWWFWASVAAVAVVAGTTLWLYERPSSSTTPGSTWGAARVLP